MDSMTLIAIISIITAGLTIAIGSIGPAIGEARDRLCIDCAGAAT